MFDVLDKVRGLFAGAVVLGALTVTPVLAADYHGQNGNVFYRGANGAFHHGMPGNGFGSRGAEGRNFAFQDRFTHPATGRSRFEHRGFGNDRDYRGLAAQNTMHRGGYPFDQRGEHNRLHANYPTVLATRDFSTRRGSGIAVISRNQPDYDFISNYAGSVDVYHANGGTYISGYGGGGNYGNQQQSSQPRPPRAKIIDVARMRNSCTYENGVCVIRP